MADKRQQAQDRAQSLFHKGEQKTRAATEAQAEREAKIVADREKNSRLKSLRLAKAAADAETKIAEAAAKKKAGPALRKRRD